MPFRGAYEVTECMPANSSVVLNNNKAPQLKTRNRSWTRPGYNVHSCGRTATYGVIIPDVNLMI